MVHFHLFSLTVPELYNSVIHDTGSIFGIINLDCLLILMNNSVSLLEIEVALLLT